MDALQDVKTGELFFEALGCVKVVRVARGRLQEHTLAIRGAVAFARQDKHVPACGLVPADTGAGVRR